MTKVVVPNLPATNVVVGRTESEDSGRQEMQQCWERKQPVDSNRPAAWKYSTAKVVVPKWDAFEKQKEREKKQDLEERNGKRNKTSKGGTGT